MFYNTHIRKTMNIAKMRRAHMLLLSFLMFLLINVMSATAVHGASPTELKLDGTCITGSVNNSSAEYYFKTPSDGMVRLGVDNGNLEFSLYSNASFTGKINVDSNGYVELKKGTYYVKVTGTGKFEISANFSPRDDHDAETNDTMETAILLKSGVKMEGNVNKAYDDQDWYKFVFTTKSYIYINLNTNAQNVFIYDADGTWMYYLNSSQVLPINNPGVYYIKVFSSENPYGYYSLKGDIVEFPTPNKITKAVYKGSRKVDLTWSKSNYADGYYLFYKTGVNAQWQKITTIPSGNTTSFTHNYGPSEGQTYYYGVQAFRKSDWYGEGEIYNQEDVDGVKVTASNAPVLSNAKATNVSGKSIQVSWNVSGKANGYKIYRRANGGSYRLVKTISSGSTWKWTDTTVKKGTNYVYKVVVSGGQNDIGDNAVTKSVKLTGSLSKVTGVKGKKNKSDNTISWKKNSLATGYMVYRKTGSGSFKRVKTTSSASYKDRNVKKGKKYTYKIIAYYNNYTYNSGMKKYINSTVKSSFSKTVSVKR